MYKQGEVNKKIIAKEVIVHGDQEYLGQQNIYRDDEYKLYKQKKAEFLNAANRYKELNKAALYTNRIKLDNDTNDILRYNKLSCEPDGNIRSCCSEGCLIRKRSYRRIHEDSIQNVTVCTLEPWFVRYLKLCKFIYAGRTIIVYNRLMRNLRILKTWDENSIDALEKQHWKRYDNVSYPHVFEKYI